jgi:hypothetical protein
MNTSVARRLPSAFALLAAGSLMAAAPSSAGDDHQSHRFATELSGYNEVHFVAGAFPSTQVPAGTLPALRGAIFTPASGKFRARLDGDRIEYSLEYENLVGDVTQAHIHFGQNHTVGGIVVWLCQTAGTQAPEGAVRAATPLCPPQGKVTGTIQAFQVLAQGAQGFPAGSLEALLSALRAGAAYANVHSSTFGPGEIRGQIDKHDHHHRR